MGKHQNWKLFKNSWVSTKPVLPGVWRRKEGGYIVRARVLEATTGQQKEIWKVLPEAEAPAALKWLEVEKGRLRAGGGSVAPQKSALRRIRHIAVRAQGRDQGDP